MAKIHRKPKKSVGKLKFLIEIFHRIDNSIGNFPRKRSKNFQWIHPSEFPREI